MWWSLINLMKREQIDWEGRKTWRIFRDYAAVIPCWQCSHGWSETENGELERKGRRWEESLIDIHYDKSDDGEEIHEAIYTIWAHQKKRKNRKSHS